VILGLKEILASLGHLVRLDLLEHLVVKEVKEVLACQVSKVTKEHRV